MKFYISDLSVWLLLIFYLPLVIWVLYRVVTSPNVAELKKVAAIGVTLILAYAIPLGDVTLNSIAMAKVCPNAGVHIYKKVYVDGYFYEGYAEEPFKKSPYRFIEAREPGKETITRVERVGDKFVKTELSAPTAEYEYLSKGWTEDRQARVGRLRYAVINRNTGEVLAERLLFNPFMGWVDSYLLGALFGVGLQGCHGNPSHSIAGEVLLPKQ